MCASALSRSVSMPSFACMCVCVCVSREKRGGVGANEWWGVDMMRGGKKAERNEGGGRRKFFKTE